MTHDWHWTFGNGCHIEFSNGGAPSVRPDHVFNTFEGCASVSDAGGALLFYTDGTRLYDAAGTTVNSTPPTSLGGTSSAAHAAIIVPPAGGGTRYHIFAVGDWDGGGGNIGAVTHTTVSAWPSVSLPPPPPTDLTAFGPQRAAEKLAAVPHADCGRYWVVSFDGSPTATGASFLYAMLVDSDLAPSATVTSAFATTPGFCVKFSPDGNLLAVTSNTRIDILNFDRTTGLATPHSQITSIPAADRPYGIEFSPNGKYLYFSGYMSGYVRRHQIGASATFASTALIGTWVTNGRANYKVGALQLAPNGRIYGTKVSQRTLLEIANPDDPTTPPTGASVQYSPTASDATGNPLTLNKAADLGLPTFTRIADDCRGDRCARLAAQVDERLAATPKVNALRPCRDDQPIEQPRCAPVEMPRLAPWTSIRWGDSECDCIEGDDTEVMHLTVCNPYRNLTLGGLTIHQLVVVDANGNPPPDLPDGSPSIQLTPLGPYCFDDLGPCRCVTREFAVRLRGAPPGRYRILVRGICFDACFHGDEDDCFTFDVCKD